MTSKIPHRSSDFEFASTLTAQPNTASHAELLTSFPLEIETSEIPYVPVSSSLGSTAAITSISKNLQSAAQSEIREPVGSINPKATADSDPWRCKECGVKASETPLKRKGPDGTRCICNACYVRWRVKCERAERGTDRPTAQQIATSARMIQNNNAAWTNGTPSNFSTSPTPPVYAQNGISIQPQPPSYPPNWNQYLFAAQQMAGMNPYSGSPPSPQEMMAFQNAAMQQHLFATQQGDGVIPASGDSNIMTMFASSGYSPQDGLHPPGSPTKKTRRTSRSSKKSPTKEVSFVDEDDEYTSPVSLTKKRGSLLSGERDHHKRRK